MNSPVSPANSDAFTLPSSLMEVLKELGYTTFTQVQNESIPHLLAGKDLIGQSKTGSGKTLAFGLPILARINVQHRRIQALIICPTRELCAQVAREIRRAARKEPGLQVLVLAGGQPAGPQRAALEKGAHIAVGTPGRLLDLLDRSLDLRSVKTIVLDEADRMLDMGFQEDMEDILGAAPRSRQTVFFSATFPESIEEMSRRYQKDPVRVTVAEGETAKPAIQEFLHEVERADKVIALQKILRKHRPETALVFCNQKATVAELAKMLEEQGMSVAGLHGDLEQFDRDRVMARFRNRSIRVLLATDVAARGIDVEALDLVVNFDLPHKPEVYVHRIGRTGRAGKAGLAVSIMTPRDGFKIDEIEAFIGRSMRRITLEVEAQKEHAAREESQSGPAPKTFGGTAPMETFAISGGRKDKLRPGDILGALTGDAGGLDAKDVGKIEIHDRHAYVAVAKAVAAKAFAALQTGQIKGRKFKVEIVR